MRNAKSTNNLLTSQNIQSPWIEEQSMYVPEGSSHGTDSERIIPKWQRSMHLD